VEELSTNTALLIIDVQQGLFEESHDWQLHAELKPLTTDHFIRKHHGNASRTHHSRVNWTL